MTEEEAQISDVAGSSTAPRRRAGTKDLAHTIGRRLRRLREAQQLSLRALAERVGVTASLLSQVELGQVNPSVDTLFALAEALGVSVSEFFDGDSPRTTAAPAALHSAATRSMVASKASVPVVGPLERKRIELKHGVVWESLLPVEEPGLEWMVIHYPPGAASSARMQRHGGRDYGLVLKGRLTIKLGFLEHTLGPGDSISYDASTPHQLRNDGDSAVEAVWLVLDRHAVG
ncbi:MAG TPA: XRE family transcriptional regulator [Chloroflexota bacterium]|nr:XRE family transcriptional regulator [Chloroflexota bacterium]